MIESSLRLVQATFIALTLPASFPFVKACQHRLLDRNYFRPSQSDIESGERTSRIVFVTIEATINDPLNAMAQGLEQHSNGQSGILSYIIACLRLAIVTESVTGYTTLFFSITLPL